MSKAYCWKFVCKQLRQVSNFNTSIWGWTYIHVNHFLIQVLTVTRGNVWLFRKENLIAVYEALHGFGHDSRALNTFE